MRDLSKLKICFLAGTLEHGGAERQLFYILRALRQAGAGLRLLSLDRGEFWEEKIKSLGVSVTCVGDQPSRLKRLFRVLKEARKDPPDVFQSQHFFANAYVGVAARLLRMTGIGAMRNDGRSEVGESGPLGGGINLRLPKIMAANSQVAIQYAVHRGVRLHGSTSCPMSWTRSDSTLRIMPRMVRSSCSPPDAWPSKKGWIVSSPSWAACAAISIST